MSGILDWLYTRKIDRLQKKQVTFPEPNRENFTSSPVMVLIGGKSYELKPIPNEYTPNELVYKGIIAKNGDYELTMTARYAHNQKKVVYDFSKSRHGEFP
jgi:hypothetical protein